MIKTNKPIFGATAKLKFCFRLLTEMFLVGYRLTEISHILGTVLRSQFNSQGYKNLIRSKYLNPILWLTEPQVGAHMAV